MPREPNSCSKMRKPDNPYEIWMSADGLWEWHVLKKYQSPSNEAKNEFARWFCAVYSPITRQQMSQGYELGGVYVSDVKENATLKKKDITIYSTLKEVKSKVPCIPFTEDDRSLEGWCDIILDKKET